MSPRSPKQRGTAFESDIVRVLREFGLDAERVANHGNRDQGDIRVCGGILEAKATRAINLATAVDQAMLEMQHASAYWGAAVIKRRRGKGSTGLTEDAYAVMPLHMLCSLLQRMPAGGDGGRSERGGLGKPTSDLSPAPPAS